jgi:hypothetical protein
VVYLVAGDITGTLTLDESMTQFVGSNAGDWFGRSVAGGSDVNGDGLTDILIGAPGDDTAGDNAGAVFLFMGERR